MQGDVSAQARPGRCATEQLDFNTAAQPVSRALREYARRSGDQLVLYSDVGKGVLLLHTDLKAERVKIRTTPVMSGDDNLHTGNRG